MHGVDKTMLKRASEKHTIRRTVLPSKTTSNLYSEWRSPLLWKTGGDLLLGKTFSQSDQEKNRQQNVSGLLLIVGLLISRLGKNIA
jgi:hypothetical protein